MAKIDLKQDLKPLYGQSPKAPSVVDVPPLNFMMIDGTGDPNESQAFIDAVQALNSASFTLKFAVKKARGIDYAVMPTEGCGGQRGWKTSASRMRRTGSGRS